MPYEGHSLTGKVFREQLAASLPLRKQVWKQTVQAKLRAQAKALLDTPLPSPVHGGGAGGGGPHDHEASRSPVHGGGAGGGGVAYRLARARAAKRLEALAAKVGSGDPENREAQGAAVYFEALFGPEFLRDRDEPGLNAMLNYGYAVMRACVARALVGTGLHPALSVHHDNQYNAFGLVDDAMEPLRPLVDRHVLAVSAEVGVPESLTPPVKRALLEFLGHDVEFGGRRVPLSTGLGHYAASLKRVLCGQARKVAFPVVLVEQDRP